MMGSNSGESDKYCGSCRHRLMQTNFCREYVKYLVVKNMKKINPDYMRFEKCVKEGGWRLR